MFELLQAADVTLLPAGAWTLGEMTDAPGSGTSVRITETCSPDAVVISGPTDDAARPQADKIEPFGIVVRMRKNNRCAGDDEEKFVHAAVLQSTEYALATAVWNGVPGTDGDNSFILDSATLTVTAGATTIESAAKAISAFYTLGAWSKPIVHLGLTAALNLAQEINAGLFERYSLVISEAYPLTGIAVTGPIAITLGQVEDLHQYDLNVNVSDIEANRLVAFDFDPYTAVRVV